MSKSDALFVHSLAVRRNAGEHGIGNALLDFAGDQAARRQIPWVRWDCNKANEQLQAYYRRQGFSYLRTVDLPHRVSGTLFQRQAELKTSIRPDDRGSERFIICFQQRTYQRRRIHYKALQEPARGTPPACKALTMLLWITNPRMQTADLFAAVKMPVNARR